MCNKTPHPAQQPPSRITVEVSRRDALRLYLRGRGLTWTELGERLGVSPQRVHAMLSAETMPGPHRVVLIEEYSVPESLLPAESRGRRGPVRGWLSGLRHESPAT